MEKHDGLILLRVLQKKGIDVDKLMALTNSNRVTINRLLKSSKLSKRSTKIIGKLIGHDFSLEYPELEEKSDDDPESVNQFVEQPAHYKKIYLVDDSEIDALVFKLTINKVIPDISLTIFINGELAISKLLDTSINNPEALPEHIFLDLKMPVMDGAQFLEHFHRLNIDPFRTIKIHVLTSSVFPSEIQKYKSHPLVNTFISKPIEMDLFKSIL